MIYFENFIAAFFEGLNINQGKIDAGVVYNVFECLIKTPRFLVLSVGRGRVENVGDAGDLCVWMYLISPQPIVSVAVKAFMMLDCDESSFLKKFIGA